MGLELSDGQPLNEHMVQLKLKYEKVKLDLESQIKQAQSKQMELLNNIKALHLDIEKTEENCKQLRSKASRTQNRIDADNLLFREQKDEIENEITRCFKTNKQAFNDLLDTKNEINEMINKKRETERKIEDENKKFRDIEAELYKRIMDLNKEIAEYKQENDTLQVDKADEKSEKELKERMRTLALEVQDLETEVETNKNNVKKTEASIAT